MYLLQLISIQTNYDCYSKIMKYLNLLSQCVLQEKKDWGEGILVEQKIKLGAI